MYFDLNVPVPTPALARSNAPVPAKKEKGKGKGPPASSNIAATFSPAQIAALETRIDLLVHCMPLFIWDGGLFSAELNHAVEYTVIAFNQVAHTRVDPKTHTNVLDGLVPMLRARAGVVFLKRLTIVLDEDSEKGFGLVYHFLLPSART
jgi:ribonuclease P/MRP protein subunit RPP1